MIACPKCRTIQPADHINAGQLLPCPHCNALIRTELFNAFFVPKDQAATAQSAAVGGQAECFYHPGKSAVVACADCGRLLCAVCQVDLNDRPICMTCLQAGRDKEKILTLQHRQEIYDNIAINLAFWPAFMILPTLITAPAALFFSVKHLRTSSPVLPKTIFKSILALILSVFQIGGWVVFFARMVGS